jgi:predicted phosphodiesterase
MRYAVLADIHANLPALEAVLASLENENIDAYIVAGDLVGYGAFPNECVEVVRSLRAFCVAGNHDLISVGRLSDDRCIRAARETLLWTRSVLHPDAREYLSTLPRRAVTEDGVAVAHGSLDDPQAYVNSRQKAAEQLERLSSESAEAALLILGHTHRPAAYAVPGAPVAVSRAEPLALGGGRWLLNPGAVGQSREYRIRARYLVLDMKRGQATFRAIRYDVGRCRAALAQHGLPTGTYRLRPSPRRKLARAARRLAR